MLAQHAGEAHIDAVVIQIRREISEAYSKAADKRNEPPRDENTDTTERHDVHDVAGRGRDHPVIKVSRWSSSFRDW